MTTDHNQMDANSTSDPSDRETEWDRRSDVSLTRREHYRNVLQESVVAPLRIGWNDWRTRAGFLILSGFILMGTIGVRLVDTTTSNEGPRLLVPMENLAHPLGTDIMGRDILSLMVHTTPGLLKMMLAGAVFTTVIATLVGILSGYKMGTVDRVLMTLADAFMAMPGLILIIVVVVIFSPRNPYLIGIILGINAWAGLSRTVRSQVLSIRTESYVEASQVMGIRTHEIMLKDVLPNIMPYVAINFMNAARGIIFASVGLYYLGVLPYDQPNWGVMINEAYGYGVFSVSGALHWLLIPLFAVILISFGFVLMAQGLDRVFNPRIRAKYAKNSDSNGPE